MAGESAYEKARRAREKSERLARYADQWEKGAVGESRTAAALTELGPEWTHWHDLVWPGRRYANIDHIVIGPGGVFVIDSKNWSGSLTIKDDVLRQNGYRRETEVANCADSALAVGALLPRYVDRIRPVICFVRDDPIEGWARDVMLCSTSNIVRMLVLRPPVLDRGEIAEVIAVLQTRMRSKGMAKTARSPKAAGRSLPEWHQTVTPASMPQPRKSLRLSRFLAGLGVWFVLMVLVGATLSAFPGQAENVSAPAAVVAALIGWGVSRRVVR